MRAACLSLWRRIFILRQASYLMHALLVTETNSAIGNKGGEESADEEERAEERRDLKNKSAELLSCF